MGFALVTSVTILAMSVLTFLSVIVLLQLQHGFNNDIEIAYKKQFIILVLWLLQ